ncbi:MAG: flagellar basal-body MS-ring/collar protein FliF [Bacillota bacterium]|jgi:flagellar M-ring protein FliF
MNISPDKIIKQLLEYTRKLNGRKKILVISVVAGIFVLVIVMALILNNPRYEILYSGLSADEAAKIVVRLNEMGVDSKLESNGTILVPKEQEAQLKMTLSAEGYPQSTLNYDIFSNNSSYMTTDYEKKKYLLFQLQNRLQDAIKTIDVVDNAIVTISLPEEDSFVLKEDQVPATASVVLELAGNVQLNNKQIKGIGELVAKSVPGLESENVAIVDSSGNILNNQYSDGSEGITYTKLDLEKNISQVLENKINQLLQPIFGANAVRVSVNATVDINKSHSEQTTYTPIVDNSGIITQQELYQDSVDGQSNVGGVPGTGSNTGVAVYPQAGNTTGTGTGTSSSSTNYLVNQLKQQVERNGYEITDISAAVLINTDSLSRDQVNTYKEMVAFASGTSVDKVVIANAKFMSGNTPIESEELLFNLTRTQLILIGASALFLILLLVSFMLIKRKRKKIKAKKSEDEFDQAFWSEEAEKGFPGEIILNETREQGLKKQIQEFSVSNPDIVAQLLRTWLKEDEGNYE